MSNSDPFTYPSGWLSGTTEAGHSLALLALSHTAIEHRLYQAMVAEIAARGTGVGQFSVRSLMDLTGVKGYNTVSRALRCLCQKLSIERPAVAGPRGRKTSEAVYVVFSPDEIFKRRQAAGLPTVPREIGPFRDRRGFGPAMQRVVDQYNLSRREAQVALCCAEGLTNAEIGQRLLVSSQTVKFHLRNIYLKFGVRRRTELVSHLLCESRSAVNLGASEFDREGDGLHGKRV